MIIRNFCKIFMLLSCMCSLCTRCACMDLVPRDVLVEFAKECYFRKGIVANGYVTADLSDIDVTISFKKKNPQILEFDNRYIVKVTREAIKDRVVKELNDDKKVCSAIHGAKLDNNAYKFIAPTMFTYKHGGGGKSNTKMGAVKDVTEFLEGEVEDGDYSILFMEKAKGVHLSDWAWGEKPKPELLPDHGDKLPQFGTNFGKACAVMKRLGIGHQDLHFGNFFFDPDTCVINFIDFTFGNEMKTNYLYIIKSLFLRMAFSADRNYLPQCLGNFFRNYHEESGEFMSNEAIWKSFVHPMLREASYIREMAKDKKLLLSFGKTNLLLSETMKLIRPHFKKAKCPSLDEFCKKYGLRKDGQYGSLEQSLMCRTKAYHKKGCCLLNYYLWNLFICEYDSREEADKILSFILESFKEKREPWHDEMLDLMCQK